MTAAGGPSATPEDVEVWFSFRSPYSWLGLHRLTQLMTDSPGGSRLAGIPVRLRFVATFPTGPFPGDPAANPVRLGYTIEDFARIAQSYGLRPGRPSSIDTDWIRPTSAFVFADTAGHGLAFANAAFAARFSAGRDLAQDDVLADVARACGLEPERVVTAADDPALQERVRQDCAGRAEAGVFGVPTFLWRGQRFWGNDRIDWLVRSLRAAHGLGVTDLVRDPLAGPGAPSGDGGQEGKLLLRNNLTS